MYMHYIIEKCINPNWDLYHAQAKELDSQYAANIWTVSTPGMYYIWRHGASYIQLPYSVGSKRKREGWEQESGGSKWCYVTEGHQLGDYHGEVSGGVGILPHQGISVATTRNNINLWASSHEEKWRRVPIKRDCKVPVNWDGNFMGVHKPRFIDGCKGKSGQKSFFKRMLSVSGRRVERGKRLRKMEELANLSQ